MTPPGKNGNRPAAALAEGDSLNRKDITYLAPLPVFNADGTVKE